MFLTEGAGRRTHWVVAARSEGMVCYARVTPGLWGGTATVRAKPGGGPPSEFEISYDLTALTEEGCASWAPLRPASSMRSEPGRV